MVDSSNLAGTLPKLDEIQDDSLRTRVLDVWSKTVEESSYDSIEDAPWWPPMQEDFGEWKSSISHIRDVTTLSAVIADSFSDCFAVGLDRDMVIAGALLHDISKFYELDGEDVSELNDWVPHPHYGVHVLAAAGFSYRLQHIVLSHTEKSSVKPQTPEAQIVATADQLATQGLLQEQTGSMTVSNDD